MLAIRYATKIPVHLYLLTIVTQEKLFIERVHVIIAQLLYKTFLTSHSF